MSIHWVHRDQSFALQRVVVAARCGYPVSIGCCSLMASYLGPCQLKSVELEANTHHLGADAVEAARHIRIAAEAGSVYALARHSLDLPQSTLHAPVGSRHTAVAAAAAGHIRGCKAVVARATVGSRTVVVGDYCARQHSLSSHSDSRLTEDHSSVADNPGVGRSFAVEAADHNSGRRDRHCTAVLESTTWCAANVWVADRVSWGELDKSGWTGQQREQRTWNMNVCSLDRARSSAEGQKRGAGGVRSCRL